MVVEAAPSNLETKELQNQLVAVNIARNTPGVVAISMSWGFAERSSELSDDWYFTTPAGHTGITFIASSGDYGFAWYPSASPNVLSVGGTSLSLTSSGSYQSETAWYWSGGGYSPYVREPSYQSAVQTTGRRSTPDVSFDANSSTGVNIYETSPRSGQGSWRVYGGTSLGAPVWAGIMAIVDQGRALLGKGSLNGATQTIPSLYALPESDFKTVRPADGFLGTGGLSSLLGDLFGSNSKGATANIATGLGSPNGPSLIADLVTATITTKTFSTSDTGQIGSGLSLSPITKPKKHAATRSTHREIRRHRHKIKRQEVRLSGDSGTCLPHQGGARNSNHEVRMSFTVSCLTRAAGMRLAAFDSMESARPFIGRRFPLFGNLTSRPDSSGRKNSKNASTSPLRLIANLVI